MASLHKLLSEDGFSHYNSNKKPSKKVKFKDRRRNSQDNNNNIPLPIYICHDRRSFDNNHPRQKKPESLKSSSVVSSRRGGGSERSTATAAGTKDEPSLNDAAVKAMVSMLSGYIAQYIKDKNFRKNVREKFGACSSLAAGEKTTSDCKEMLTHMEIGIQSIENLVENEVTREELDFESLEYIIKVFKIVASSSSSPNYLSACAHLYLAIVYKISRNDKVSARYVLQVFVESPFLARTHLMPEVWRHFFLPHLLHIDVWRNNEMGAIEKSGYECKEKKVEALYEVYNDHMDNGTAQFARYYKEWLKIGSKAPDVPSVPLPSKSRHARSRRGSLDSSKSDNINEELYRKVFGNLRTTGLSMDLDDEKNAQEIKGEVIYYTQKKVVSHERSSSRTIQRQESWPENQRSDYYIKFLACRAEPDECYEEQAKIKNEEDTQLNNNNNTTRAISTICSSDSLKECEVAIRAIGEAWLDSNRVVLLEEKSPLQSSLIQGLMEVLSISEDDEVLELAISILAELANKNESNKQCILSFDSNLDIFLRLLRSGSLFLKAAVLLYTVGPKAGQMVASDWMPLILRVLEFGDQFQTLFSVRCMPYEAAYYFLERALTGFDEDRNLKNASTIVSLGGMGLLAKRMNSGDKLEKRKAADVLYYCVKADGTCRHYLAKNVRKDSILSSLAVRKEASDNWGHVLALLAELLRLNRTKQRIEVLKEIRKGWDCLNAMHILLIVLRRAKPEERPAAAGVLLQLDLLGEPCDYSVYREEAIDAIVQALSSCVLDEKIQEESARALLAVAGHFSYKGEAEVEAWLLGKAGFTEDITPNEHLFSNEEDEIRETWQRKTAIALLGSGKKKLCSALMESIAYSVPSLRRASLVTICWVSSYIDSIGDRAFHYQACTVLAPGLLELLSKSSSLEEKILTSFSLLNLTKGTDYLTRLSPSEETLGALRKLSPATWTATELISLIDGSSAHRVLLRN